MCSTTDDIKRRHVQRGTAKQTTIYSVPSLQSARHAFWIIKAVAWVMPVVMYPASMVLLANQALGGPLHADQRVNTVTGS